MAKPIVVQEILNLTREGVTPEFINFKCVSMESDKFLCVRDKSGDQASILIVDLQATPKPQSSRHKIAGDSAVMNPSSKILALREDAGNSLQIFNLDIKSRMKAHKLEERVEYWHWISSSTIAIVTPTAVYHWSMDGNAEPRKICDRKEELANSTILSYRADESESWLLLIGVERQGDGTLRGLAQLHSVEKNVSKVIDGHAGSFVNITSPSTGETQLLLCLASNQAGQGGKLFVMELPVGAKTPTFERKVQSINFASAQDFPVALQTSDKHGLLYLVTKSGFVYLYDILSATLLYSESVTTDAIFCTAFNQRTKGFLGVTNKGVVISISANEQFLVKYVQQTLGNPDLALRIAATAGMGGADELFVAKFNALLAQMNVAEAVKLAAEAPNEILRTPETIKRLQAIAIPGQQPPLSLYFKYLMEKGKLNENESLELAQVILQKAGGAEYLKKLIEDDKLSGSVPLGDLVAPHSPELAIRIYHKAQAYDKVLIQLIHKGDFDKLLAYCDKVSYTPNWLALLNQLLNIPNPEGAAKFATILYEKFGSSAVDPNRVVDMFLQRSLVKQATAYLLDILRDDKPEDGTMQTRLLEINLLYSPPQVADQILGQEGLFTHYDKPKIATLAEKAQLFQRALEIYGQLRTSTMSDTQLANIKRVVVNTNLLNPTWLADFLGTLSPEDCLECLKELLTSNARQNFKICVQVASKYAEVLGTDKLIELFLSFNSYEALYYFLGSIVNYSKNPEVHFRYIEAATKVGQFAEVERVTRESNYYDGERVKAFLKEQRLQDPWPLINVCEKSDNINELVRHLLDTNNQSYIDSFVQKRNPARMPEVAGALLDYDAQESYVKNLILSIGGLCPVEPLVEAVESRNRLRILQPWLEARREEGINDVALHNALGKISIDTNNNPEDFLRSNNFYDPLVIGKYCENRDPALAFIAYERGQCDDELIDITNKACMFKQQAKYLVKRQDGDLWEKVLAESNEHRKSLIDQVVHSVLPDTKSPEEISSTVKAFMAADLPHELTELLEKIVLHGKGEFKQNRYLQNLLLLTAVRADHSKVMDYLNRLDNFDEDQIATMCIENELFEEAFAIYKKNGKHNVQAIGVLLTDLKDIKRAREFADRVNEKDVWSSLAAAQLREGLITEAIDSFVKAEDASKYNEVIQTAQASGHFSELVRYLQMCRVGGKAKQSVVDTELAYSLAKTARLADLEEFVANPNVASLLQVGDRLFHEENYEAARILYQAVSNYSRLAICLVKLGQYYAAVDAAQKANSTKTWKEICFACVVANPPEFRLAQMCALHIIIHADEMDEFIRFYEERGLFDEVISCLKAALGHERAHMGLFTELGVLFAKYRPEKLMEHIKLFHRRLNVHKLVRVCEQFHHWAAARFLYINNDETDNAVKIMMAHPTDAWDHEIFKDALTKSTTSLDLLYQSIHFYLEYSPANLADLLTSITTRLDPQRVVTEVKKANQLAFVKPYLESVQSANIGPVNESLNALYIEEDDFVSLKNSVDGHNNFDQVGLAQQLEKHDLMEFRRIAVNLFKKNGRWKHALEISKKDQLYKDAMETAAESGDADLAEDLLRFFVEKSLFECFAACLYTCYELIRPDVALELSWRYKIIDFGMPFLIQMIKDYSTRLAEVEKKLEKADTKTAPDATHLLHGAPLSITAPPGMMMMPPTNVPPIHGGGGGAFTSPNAFHPGYGSPQQPFNNVPMGGGVGMGGRIY